MNDIKTGNMVKIIAGPAAGETGIVTMIHNNRAQVTNLFYGKSYYVCLTDLERTAQSQPENSNKARE